MPIGSGTSTPENASYGVTAYHVSDTNHEYPLSIRFDSILATPPASESQKDSIAQALVDLFDGSSDFTFDSAVKGYDILHGITPTP